MAQLPSARIYIMIQETGEVIVQDTFVSISTDLQIDGGSSATIKLMNRDDQWITFASRDTKQQTALGVYLQEIYSRSLYHEVNAKREYLLQQALQTNTANAWQTVYSLEQFMLFNLFCRIWIDFRGRKDLIGLQTQDDRKFSNLPDRWYAGFTGMITNISETLGVGKDKHILLQCKDMSRFFECTSVATSFGFDPQITLFTDPKNWDNAYLQNTFAGFVDGGNIINSLVNLTNITFHRTSLLDTTKQLAYYPFAKFWSLPNLLSGKITNYINPQGQDTGIAQIPSSGIVQPTYTGITNRRAPTGFNATSTTAGATKTSDRVTPSFLQTQSNQILQKYIKSDIIQFIPTKGQIDPLTGKPAQVSEYIEDPTDSRNYFDPDTFTNELTQTVIGVDTYQGASYSMDTMIANNTDSDVVNNPWQQTFSNLGDSNVSRMTVAEMIKQISGVTGYHIYCDAKGNLIYQKCRYDDFPGTDPGNYDSILNSSDIPFIDETPNDGQDPLNLGLYAQPNSPYAVHFHGRNYLIGDESLLSWKFSQDESSLYTVATVPNIPQQDVPQDTYLALNKFTGKAISSPNISSRFGIRMLQMAQVLTKSYSNLGLSNLLAETYLRKVNAALDMCEITLNMRPDLQIGRTMYLLERRKLYYITGIQNHLEWGESFETIVEGAYGHNPFNPILDPWRIALTTPGGAFNSTDAIFTNGLDDLQTYLNEVIQALTNPK